MSQGACSVCPWKVAVLAEYPTLEGGHKLQPHFIHDAGPCQCNHNTTYKISLCHGSLSTLPLESKDLMKTTNTRWDPSAQWSFTRCGPSSSVKGTKISSGMEQTSFVQITTNLTTSHCKHRPSLTRFRYHSSQLFQGQFGINHICNINILNLIFIHVVNCIVEKLHQKLANCFQNYSN